MTRGTVVTVIGLLVVAVGVLYVSIAAGLWTFRSWAWALGVAVTAFAAVTTLLALASGATGMLTFVGLFVNAGALAYLLVVRRGYRHASRVRHGGP